jgi:hypothetical protein
MEHTAAAVSGYLEMASSKRSPDSDEARVDGGGESTPRMRLPWAGDQDGLTAVEPGRLPFGRPMDGTPGRGDQSGPGVAATDCGLGGLSGEKGDDERLENREEGGEETVIC